VALSAPLTGGCQLLTWAVASFVPPPKTPARYTLDPSYRVMVIPDSQYCRLEMPMARDLLAEKVTQRLAAKNLVAETVPYAWLRMVQERMDLEYQAAHGRPTPLDAMAKKASADAVIHIDIRSFHLRAAPGQPLWHGRMTAVVSVVDADGRRLWPADRVDGYPLSVDMPTVSDDNAMYAMTLTEQLADQMAVQVVRLFHEHDGSSPG
ncbi:MAG: hypothetical protein GX591_07395, partial [Planctomycetes bacterium]|nr:hypothetical protein [Planctomycetota bacterium]